MNSKGYSDVVIGLQFGDEGKARVIDMLAGQYDVIARFNGGANAGHTIGTKNGKLALQQVPSGVLYPETTLYIGSGCVVNVEKLIDEIDKLHSMGIDLTGRLRISPQASVIQPKHIEADGHFKGAIGTTGNGIGPAYADRALRVNNVTVGLLGDRRLKPYVETDPLYLEKRVENGSKVLFEGAQSTMLDVVRGTGPFVTASSTVAAAAYVGGDLSVRYHRKIIGVAKAIMSRVGHGPFPSEYGGAKSEEYCMKVTQGRTAHDREYEKSIVVDDYIKSTEPLHLGAALRIISGEYGTVTGRPRRIGMFDLVQLAYAIAVNGVTELVINKCDVLKEYSRTHNGKIPVVTGYRLEGEEVKYFPIHALYKVEPIVQQWDSFTDDVGDKQNFTQLPAPLQRFVNEVALRCNCRIMGIGVGPKREQFIRVVP